VITPRRFNPRGSAWLPVLHTERGERVFHAFFSNTPLAHRLGRTRDWVVIYWDRDGVEGQGTVVTERRGELSGLRVVRGREDECRRHYRMSARIGHRT
jgi:putative hydrolase